MVAVTVVVADGDGGDAAAGSGNGGSGSGGVSREEDGRTRGLRDRNFTGAYDPSGRVSSVRRGRAAASAASMRSLKPKVHAHPGQCRP